MFQRCELRELKQQTTTPVFPLNHPLTQKKIYIFFCHYKRRKKGNLLELWLQPIKSPITKLLLLQMF